MNRESICKQQIHCLSCPLSVRITGKDCRTLTHKELIEMIVKEPDNLCVICGTVIPEGRMICPMCGTKDDVESYAKLIRTDLPKEDEPLAKAAVETALKIKDECEQAFRQGYLTGFSEGMKAACEIKQENERLKRRIIILEQQASRAVHDIDAEYE